MQTLPLRFYDTGSNGDLMSRFTNDVDTIGMMLSSTLVQLLSGALSIVGTLVLMIYTNVWLTVITLAMMPVMLVNLLPDGARNISLPSRRRLAR